MDVTKIPLSAEVISFRDTSDISISVKHERKSIISKILHLQISIDPKLLLHIIGKRSQSS